MFHLFCCLQLISYIGYNIDVSLMCSNFVGLVAIDFLFTLIHFLPEAPGLIEWRNMGYIYAITMLSMVQNIVNS